MKKFNKAARIDEIISQRRHETERHSEEAGV